MDCIGSKPTRVASIAALAVIAASSQALLIDDFTTGPYSVNLVTPSAMDTAFQTATVPGGTRTTRLFVESNPLSVQINLTVGSGFAISDSGTMGDNWVRVGYGYENNGSGGLATDPLNLDLSAWNAFKIDFRSNDLANDVKVYVGTWTGTTYNLSTSSLVAPGGNQTTPFSLYAPFAGFAGTAAWNDVDVIVFEFDNTPSGDFAIERFEAVPEPASILALAFGISTIAVRRRIKR